MPRAAGQKDYVSMAGGLVTEASPLNFPEGATSGELNFTLNKENGLRERRKGFDFLYDDTVSIAGQEHELVNTLYWRGTGYLVIIFSNNTPGTYLNLITLGDTFEQFTDIRISENRVTAHIAELTNYLVVTLSDGSKPILLEYDEVNEEISVSEVNIHVRDFELVEDGLSNSDTPSTLSENHHYNLLNAGWYVDRKDENTGGYPLDNVIDMYFTEFSLYPSNADTAAVGMITNSDGEYTFDPQYVRDAGFGNSLAPRGHYVYDINDFNRDDRRLSPDDDGTPTTTLTSISVIDSSGEATYDPDDPTGGGGGVTPPWNDFPDTRVPPGYNLP